MKTVKMIKYEAMEFLEAKKPLAVEISPVIARAKLARPTRGERKVLSTEPLQEKNGVKPF